MLTDFEPVNAVGNLAVRARLLDKWAKIGVLQRDAVFISAGGIDDLTVRNRTVGVNPIAPTPTVCSGGILDLLAVAVMPCW
jgi:hypothetical protein